MTDELRDVSHTNPYTDESFGERVQVFERGRTVAADGGERGDDDAESEQDAETMADVAHEPPNGSDGAHRVYERGTEGRDDSV